MCSILILLDLRYLSLNGNDRQTQLVDLCQHAVQSGLVGHLPFEQALTIFLSDGEAVEPIRPGLVKLPLDANYIVGWLIVITTIRYKNPPLSLTGLPSSNYPNRLDDLSSPRLMI